MDGSGDYHTEWSKSAKTNIIQYHIQPKKDANEPIYKTETDSQI